MPEYLAPGVFLEEIDTKPPAIEGVSTTTTGMVGFAVRGPTIGRPVLVTNPLQFRQRFGGPAPAAFAAVGDMYYAAQGFFANGGKRLYIVRAAGGTQALFATQGGYIGRLAPGADAALAQKELSPANLIGLTDGMAIDLKMVRNGVTYAATTNTIEVKGIDRATGVVTLKNAIDIAPTGPTSYAAGSTAVITKIGGLDATSFEPKVGARPASFTIKAADGGSWGDDIVITSRHRSGGRAVFASFISGALDLNHINVVTASGFYVGAWVEIDRGSTKGRIFRQVNAVNGTVLTLAGLAMVAGDFTPAPPATETVLTVWEFALTATYDGVTESFPSLTLANVPGKYVVDVVNKGSSLISIDPATMPLDTNPFFFPSGDDGLNLTATTAGTDVAPTAAMIRGADNGPGKRTGLRALEEIEEISMIVAPGWGDASVQEAMIEQCERLKYRVALLDPEVVTAGIPPTLNDIQNQRRRFDTKYAAIYYPRLVIRDAADNLRAIGPSGHVAGICARVDNERGVWKAPGNETIRNLVDLEVIVTRGEHEVLNPQPNNINVLRDFRNEGRGLRVYGARCITSATDWKYLSVRRLFIFVERSLDIGTQWAVFEPNDKRLWDRLIDSVGAFLTRLWRDGALMGLEKAHAFYIRCGTDTMTQDDIDNGRLIMEVGIAPVKPAEFVIIRITQKAGLSTES